MKEHFKWFQHSSYIFSNVKLAMFYSSRKMTFWKIKKRSTNYKKDCNMFNVWMSVSLQNQDECGLKDVGLDFESFLGLEDKPWL